MRQVLEHVLAEGRQVIHLLARKENVNTNGIAAVAASWTPSSPLSPVTISRWGC